MSPPYLMKMIGNSQGPNLGLALLRETSNRIFHSKTQLDITIILDRIKTKTKNMIRNYNIESS